MITERLRPPTFAQSPPCLARQPLMLSSLSNDGAPQLPPAVPPKCLLIEPGRGLGTGLPGFRLGLQDEGSEFTLP
jgi:hypothetical protein